ncbi:MAG: YdcF family protein [Muribaculaceae bacterium]|nr:YdcF family protein [Muribaculaceae bacterium]
MKKIILYTLGIGLVILIGLLITYGIVCWNASDRTYDDVNEIPHNKVGLLLATSPITPGGAHNFYFENRIKSTEELYKAGKVDYIIASGGDYRDNHRFGCDEPKAIKDSLVARGVPADRIILDYDGTRTLNSIVKAKDIYRLDSVTLISQKYHNERAIYLADKNDLYAIGYNAEPSPIRRNRIKNTLREVLARPKMFLDFAFGTSPKFNVDEKLFTETVFDTGRNVEIRDTLGLRIYFPKYSNIELVCGEMPSKDDRSVIMFAEAAFTGELLDEFKHSNIAGDHVTGGKSEKGYKCKRNNGAFVYYNNEPKFLYNQYSSEFDMAANNEGCGFAQEMMIHEGKVVPHTRPDNNKNEFRSLCLIDGKVAVADSKGYVNFGDFINDLLKVGATEALYLDMGPGWNYSWYRDSTGNPIEIHSFPTKFATNWITFYNTNGIIK